MSSLFLRAQKQVKNITLTEQVLFMASIVPTRQPLLAYFANLSPVDTSSKSVTVKLADNRSPCYYHADGSGLAYLFFIIHYSSETSLPEKKVYFEMPISKEVGEEDVTPLAQRMIEELLKATGATILEYAAPK